MKIKKNIASSETGFLFNPGTGDSFSANPVATDILQGMKENKSTSEIQQAVLEKYQVDKTQLMKDWDDFMIQLRDNNLLEA
jgi:ornithine carbamoyltransferase